VKIIEPQVFADERGLFMETWNLRKWADFGVASTFVQDNHSLSGKGVLRGLHYQVKQPQGKLVRAVAGAVYDVVVDIRRSSPNFGRWTGVELSATNRRALWVPEGFAHGFLSLVENAEVAYKCTAYYAPEYERTILWNDPALAISWPLEGVGSPRLSPKDVRGMPLAVAEVYA
jgi:dTDP-4-dehydrorhamnose 3,5-epimerase